MLLLIVSSSLLCTEINYVSQYEWSELFGHLISSNIGELVIFYSITKGVIIYSVMLELQVA